MEWLRNLSKAIKYVEDNLDQEISYEEAARIACCSPYYFQRMFSYVAGIPLSEYIRRRRMTQAAFELQSADVKIMDIALKYGYTSPTAFNRAFRKVHGLSPIDARRGGNRLNAFPPIRFSIQIAGGRALAYRIEEKEAMRVVGLCIPLTEDMERNQELVPQFWKELQQEKYFSILCDLAGQSPEGLLGITACQGHREPYYYIAAGTEQPIPEGMVEYWIPKGTWAIFEDSGPYQESVREAFRQFLTDWLPFSGYVYAGLPDIEVYKTGGQPGSGRFEVRIAVRKENEKGERGNGYNPC